MHATLNWASHYCTMYLFLNRSLNLACSIVYDEAERHNPTSCSRTGKTKQCSLIVKFTCKNYFAAGVYLSEGPLPTRHLFGVVEKFCRFWIWSDTECKTPAEYTYSHRKGGEGESWTREMERGTAGASTDHKAGLKYTNMIECTQEIGYLQSITCREVPLQVNLFRCRHFALLSMSLIFLRHCTF